MKDELKLNDSLLKGVNSIITNTDSTRQNTVNGDMKDFTMETQQTAPTGRINFYNGIDNTDTFSNNSPKVDRKANLKTPVVKFQAPRVTRSLNFHQVSIMAQREPKRLKNPFGKDQEAEDMPQLVDFFSVQRFLNYQNTELLKKTFNKSDLLNKKYGRKFKKDTLQFEKEMQISPGYTNKSVLSSHSNSPREDAKQALETKKQRSKLMPHGKTFANQEELNRIAKQMNQMPMKADTMLQKKLSALSQNQQKAQLDKTFQVQVKKLMTVHRMKSNLQPSDLKKQPPRLTKLQTLDPKQLTKSLDITTQKSIVSNKYTINNPNQNKNTMTPNILNSKPVLQRPNVTIDVQRPSTNFAPVHINRRLFSPQANNKNIFDDDNLFENYPRDGYSKNFALQSQREVPMTSAMRKRRFKYYEEAKQVKAVKEKEFRSFVEDKFDRELSKDLKLIRSIPESVVAKDLQQKLQRTIKRVIDHTKDTSISQKETFDLSLLNIVDQLKERDRQKKKDKIKQLQKDQFAKYREEVKRRKRIQEQIEQEDLGRVAVEELSLNKSTR